MPYATVAEVKERVSFNEITVMSTPKLQGYIDRATSWIHREAQRKFKDETDEDLLADLRTATVLLVEYLWYQDNPDIKESSLSPIETEKIGSYSYTMRDVQTIDSIKEREYEGTRTGIKELDLILQSLKQDIPTGISFFSISGSSSGYDV